MKQNLKFKLTLLRAENRGETVYDIALVLFGILSCFFTSNIQSTLPDFSQLMRLGLTGLVTAMLLVKIYLLTTAELRERLMVTLCLGLASLLSYTSGDRWLLATLLLILGAKDTDPEKSLRLFVVTATASLLAAELLMPLGIVPWVKGLSRAPDFGFGHYNGFAGRVFGVYVGWLVLLFRRLKWWGWVLMGTVPVLVLVTSTSRGGTMACLVLFLGMLICRLFPQLIGSKAVKGLILLYGVAVWGISYYAMVAFNKESALWRMLDKLNNMRFAYGHKALLENGVSLLGGTPVDTGWESAVDNSYMAFLMNKGILGAMLLFALFTLFLAALVKRNRMVEAVALCAVLLYGMTENRILNLYVNPLLLWASILFYPEMGSRLEREGRRPDDGNNLKQ